MIAITIENAALETGLSVSALLCAIESGDLVATANETVGGGYITTQLHLARYLSLSLDDYLTLLIAKRNSEKAVDITTESRALPSTNIHHHSSNKPTTLLHAQVPSEVALERLTLFLKLNNHDKGEFTKQYIEQIVSGFESSVPNYVDKHGLDIKPVKKGSNRFRLDLRTTGSDFRELLGVERRRLTEEATTHSAAKAEANKLIHDKLIALGKTTSLSPDITASQQMAISVYRKVARKLTRKEIKPQTASDRFSKVAVWYHIFEEVELSEISQELIDSLVDEFFLNECDGSTINKYMIELRNIVMYVHSKTTGSEPIDIPSYQSKGRDFKDIPYSKLQTFIPIYTDCRIEQLGIELGYWTGMRFTNLWNDFNIRKLKLRDFNKPISVRNFSNIEIPSHLHKNKRKVSLPLSEQAERVIQELIQERKSQGINHPNLLALDNNGRIFVRNQDKWKLALEKSELETDIVFHHFRHYRAKRMIETKRSFNTVRQALGLVSEKMVEIFYGHISVSDEAIQAMDESAIFDIIDRGVSLPSTNFERTEAPHSLCSTKSPTPNTGSANSNSATAANECELTAAPRKQRKRKRSG